MNFGKVYYGVIGDVIILLERRIRVHLGSSTFTVFRAQDNELAGGGVTSLISG